MNRIDIAIDLETLATTNSPIITQIAAVAFDIKTGAILREFNLAIDIESSIKAGLDFSADTLKWWLKQDKEAQEKALFGEASLKSSLNNFSRWIYAVSENKIGAVYLWGNGILADNTWVKSAYTAVGLQYPIHYRNDRDVRTINELAAIKMNTTVKDIQDRIPNDGVKHDALSDARWAARLVSTSFNLICG